MAAPWLGEHTHNIKLVFNVSGQELALLIIIIIIIFVYGTEMTERLCNAS